MKRGPKPKKSTARDRLRDTAHRLVHEAIVTGELARPETKACGDCGGPAECYDHRNYNHPLAVDAVCKGCNNRRGPGFPFPTDADNRQYKLDKANRTKNWGGLDGGDGYEPLAARLLINAPEAMNESDICASFWNDYTRAKHPKLGKDTWKGRADWFKARDPWYA